MIILMAGTVALILLSLTAITNVLIFPRLRRGSQPARQVRVSILIPARNEARVIGATIRHILAQTYPNFELLIMDDASTDGTAGIAQAAGVGDPRLRVLTGTPMPPGWAGKPWACQQLAEAASGDILIFTDADVQWEPEALAALLHWMESSPADVYTIWPTQQTETWSERLVVPLMAMVIVGYLPLLMVHYSSLSIFAAANGQCMAWRREAYQRIGGHRSVASSVLDDVQHARAAKRAGLTLRMGDGSELIGCRMYEDWHSVRDGFAKNILAGYGSPLALAFGTIFHLVILILPWPMLLVEATRPWALAMIALGIGLRALSAAFTHQRVLDAFLLPVSALLMTRIALQAFIWHFTGGPRWKGRIITHSGIGRTIYG